MKRRLLITSLFLIQFAFSQNRTCGMEEKMQEILFNPVLKKAHAERQAQFEIEYSRLLALDNSRITNPLATTNIPVAVHFPDVPNNSSVNVKNCLRQLAQTQINVINADYNAANADLTNWTNGASTFYPNVIVGNLDVNFSIATQNHPNGTGIPNGTVAVTFGTDFLNDDDYDATWAGYMNFVVRDLGNELLGYSPLGGSINDGGTVVMNTICFGKDTNGCLVNGTNYKPQAPYNLGRTVTHELGHFFNLNHIFKSANSASTNCSGADSDGIADTPKQAGCTYGCITPGSKNACDVPKKALSMNYMDYSNDACMYMFTNGQKTRMQAYINVIKNQFKTDVLVEENFNLSNTFAVYPNPNDGQFTISFSDLQNQKNINVYDMMGRTVYSNVINVSNVDFVITLDAVAKGIYTLVINEEGRTSSQKIIIN